MQRVTATWLTLFCIGLLFFTNTIRSTLLVDTTFMPRFVSLAIVLLITLAAGAAVKIRLRRDLFEIIFILFYGWSLLSVFWSIDYAEAIVYSQLVFLSLALFLVITALAGSYPGFEKLFIRTHLLVLIFSFALAFYKMSLLPFYDPYKIISVCANNNLYAGFLLISLPLVFAGYILLKGSWRYLSVATGILCLFFIIIIQSRAVYLGVATALLISLFILQIRYRHALTKRNIVTGLLATLLLSAGIFLFTLSLDQTRRQYFLHKIMVWEYFQSYEELQARKIRELRDPDDHSKMAPFDFSEDYYSNASLRVIFWQKSLGLVAKHPITGVGAGNWRLAVASVAKPPNPGHTIGNFTYSEPHNEWMRIIAELGIPGLILALILFLLPPMFGLYRILFGPVKPPLETLFYASFIVGFYIFALFDFPLRRIEHNILLWSIFAFMLKKVPLHQKNDLTPYPSPWRRGEAWVICLIAVTLVISAIRIRSEYYTLFMFRNEKKNDARVIEYARKAENFLYHITPNTFPIAWFEGVAHYRRGEDTLALVCFRRAMVYTPYEVRVLNDYAAVLFKLGEPKGAIRSLKETLCIDPFFDEARFNLGAIYYLTGQTDSARAEVERCRESERKREFLDEMVNIYSKTSSGSYP